MIRRLRSLGVVLMLAAFPCGCSYLNAATFPANTRHTCTRPRFDVAGAVFHGLGGVVMLGSSAAYDRDDKHPPLVVGLSMLGVSVVYIASAVYGYERCEPSPPEQTGGETIQQASASRLPAAAGPL